MEDDLKVKCPVCGIFFALEKDTEEGDILNCPECETELKVSSLSPAEVYEVEYEVFGSDLDELEETGDIEELEEEEDDGFSDFDEDNL
jgi:lysine biosynthesis protein LysW